MSEVVTTPDAPSPTRRLSEYCAAPPARPSAPPPPGSPARAFRWRWKGLRSEGPLAVQKRRELGRRLCSRDGTSTTCRATAPFLFIGPRRSRVYLSECIKKKLSFIFGGLAKDFAHQILVELLQLLHPPIHSHLHLLWQNSHHHSLMLLKWRLQLGSGFSESARIRHSWACQMQIPPNPPGILQHNTMQSSMSGT